MLLSYDPMPPPDHVPDLPVPLLHPSTRLADIETLKAWYEAVADTLRAEMSFDLFALWLFRPDGEPLLVEPEALEKDHLTVPAAHPTADVEALARIEDRVRRAGYGGVELQPIRYHGIDVALLLVAGFSPAQLGPREVALVTEAAHRMAPILAGVIYPEGLEPPTPPAAGGEPGSQPEPAIPEATAEYGGAEAELEPEFRPEAEPPLELQVVQGQDEGEDEALYPPVQAGQESEGDVLPPDFVLEPPESGPLFPARPMRSPEESSLEAAEPPHPRSGSLPATTHLYEAVADALAGAGAPRDLMLAVSYALQSVLPHDAFELLIPDQAGETVYRLGLHGHGALWADPSLVRGGEWLAPEFLFGESFRLLVPDTQLPGSVRVPELVTVRGLEAPPRSLLGVKLRVVERVVGYLLIGSQEVDAYSRAQLEQLDRLGGLLAARVEGFVLAWQYQVLRSQFDLLRHLPMHLSRVAEILALTPVLGEGTRLFFQQCQALLPAVQLEFAIRLGEEGRVVIVKPGYSTPLTDLQQESVEGSGVGAVVRGESSYLLSTQEDREGALTVLVVPLRSGGRIFGAMAITGRGPAPFTRSDMAVAQAMADLIAPHFDLARRSAQAPPVFTGWRRSSGRRTLGELPREEL